MKPTVAVSPDDYIAQIPEPRRAEFQQLHDLIQKTVPQLKPATMGEGIGYGNYHYKYASGREGDWPPVGLASRKRYISVYLMGVRDGKYVAEANAHRLPKADVGKSCIRFKRLADIDLDVLADVIREGASALPSEEVKP
jgi:hypothetical protein